MAEQILDFKASEPANGQTGFTPVAIPVAPIAPVQLADLGISLSFSPPAPTTNRVELVATVGVRASAASQLRFRILRDGSEIFNTVEGVESFEGFYTVTFETIDFNVPLGFHTYTLDAQIISATGNAQVVGPITFSGLAV